MLKQKQTFFSQKKKTAEVGLDTDQLVPTACWKWWIKREICQRTMDNNKVIVLPAGNQNFEMGPVTRPHKAKLLAWLSSLCLFFTLSQCSFYRQSSMWKLSCLNSWWKWLQPAFLFYSIKDKRSRESKEIKTFNFFFFLFIQPIVNVQWNTALKYPSHMTPHDRLTHWSWL